MTKTTDWRSEISELQLLPRSALSKRWEAIHGFPPPKGARRILLERAIAWHIQAKVFGGHSTKVRKQLYPENPRPGVQMAYGSQDRNVSDASRKQSEQQTDRVNKARSRSAPRPGARLVREWNGVAHVVDVTAHGFVWQGRSWKSLSAIAIAITGARWSGPRFFGL
jgi:hypothetical protein